MGLERAKLARLLVTVLNKTESRLDKNWLRFWMIDAAELAIISLRCAVVVDFGELLLFCCAC